MKNILLLIVFIFSSLIVTAQFVDDMESYTDGEPISTAHWTNLACGGGIGCAILSSSEKAFYGNLSGLIPNDGTTDAILYLGNKIFDVWCIEFFMYVPSGNEASWQIKDCVPNCTTDWDIYFSFNQDLNSPGEGKIINSALGEISFNFPHDEWFRVVMSWDISNGIDLSTWEASIDSQIVIPYGTNFTLEDGTTPTSLGGINFFSTGNNSKYFIDEITYVSPLYGQGCYSLGVPDFIPNNFVVIPNPVENIITLSANEKITSFSITNILGQLLFEQKINVEFYTFDMSNYPKGTYIIKAIIGGTINTQKIIK